MWELKTIEARPLDGESYVMGQEDQHSQREPHKISGPHSSILESTERKAGEHMRLVPQGHDIDERDTKNRDRKDRRREEHDVREKRHREHRHGNRESKERDYRVHDASAIKDQESRSRKSRGKEIRSARSRAPSLPRKPIWGERGEDFAAPNHKILKDKVPDHTDAPWYVRMWIAAYMRYRGLDDNLAANVHYTGAEFQTLSLPDMIELFTAKCGVKHKEAEILGSDVWQCVQSAAAPPPSASLNRYADFVGEDVQRLRALLATESGIFRRIWSLFFWARAVVKTVALTYVGIVFLCLVAACIYVFMVTEEVACFPPPQGTGEEKIGRGLERNSHASSTHKLCIGVGSYIRLAFGRIEGSSSYQVRIG
ncbi:hypothetical protein SCARD494_14016 [Seiridium cardinale]